MHGSTDIFIIEYEKYGTRQVNLAIDSNCILVLDWTPDSNGLGKDNGKTRW